MAEYNKEELERFLVWVENRLKTEEQMSTITYGVMEAWLELGMRTDEDVIGSKFGFHYTNINNYIEAAKEWAERESIPDLNLENAIDAFMNKKSEIRKMKAYYKKLFAELNEKIRLKNEDKDYITKYSNDVMHAVAQYGIQRKINKAYMNEFTPANLSQTISGITQAMLQRILEPSEQQVMSYVQEYINYRSVPIFFTGKES